MSWRLSGLMVVVIAIVFGAWLWRQHDQELKRLAKEVPARVQVDLSAKGIELRQGENGQPRWSLKAENAEYTRESGDVEVSDLVIDYYVGEKKDPLQVHASKGTINQKTDEAKLWPEVKASMAPYDLRADELYYKGKKREIELRGNVYMTRSANFLKAKSMVLDLDTKNIVAQDGVEAVFLIEAVPPSGKGTSQ